MDNLPTPSENNDLIQPAQPVQPAPVAPPVQPAANQFPPPAVPTTPSGNTNSAVDIVWQWLCYGLWEWALISLAVLLSSTLSYYFDNSNGSGDYTFVLYVLAAMLCLLPLAFIANHVYSKREANQKHGFAAVIMVINAVGVFLASLAGLIVFVVSVLSLFTSESPSTSTNIVITSSIIVVVLGALLFVRIINPAPLAWFMKLFPYLVILVAGVAVVLAVVGPFRSQVTNRQDRLIEDNLSTLNGDIQDYVTDNSALPTNLSALDYTDDQGSKQLATSGLVTYQALAKSTEVNSSDSNTDGTDDTTTQATLNYKLCVTFKGAIGDPSGNASSSVGIDGDQSSALNDVSTDHKSGYVCYNLTATSN